MTELCDFRRIERETIPFFGVMNGMILSLPLWASVAFTIFTRRFWWGTALFAVTFAGAYALVMRRTR